MEEFKSAKGERMENSVSVEYFRGKSYLNKFIRHGSPLYNIVEFLRNP